MFITRRLFSIVQYLMMLTLLAAPASMVFAKSSNTKVKKSKNSEANLKRQCKTNKKACCASRRSAIAGENRNDQCIVDLIFELNVGDGDLSPYAGILGKRDKKLRISNVCWSHVAKKIPRKATLNLVALGDSFSQVKAYRISLPPHTKCPKLQEARSAGRAVLGK